MLTTTFLVFAVAAPPTAPAETPAESFRQAERLYSADRFGEAEPLFQAALLSKDRYLKRRAYNRLLDLYIRSGRSDKAIRLDKPYRDWLQTIGDDEGLAELDVVSGQCQLELGYTDAADKLLVSALSTKVLPPDRRLEALRLRAEVAIQQKNAAEKDRWKDLEKVAKEFAEQAPSEGDPAARVTAGRYLAEALFRRGDISGALAILDRFPAMHERLNDSLGLRDTQRQRAKLLAAKGKYAEATTFFKEALELHRKHQPKRRLIAGDILAEWAMAAVAAGRLPEAAKLREQAAVEYRQALDSSANNPDAGGPLAAFVRLQTLTRSARQFQQALDVTLNASERWSGDPLLDARLKSDRGGLELMTSAYQTARKSLTLALADLDAAEPPNLRALPKVLVNLATAEIGCGAPEQADKLLARCTELYSKHKLPADPVRVECDYLLGVSAARRGEFAAAMSHFRDGHALCEKVGKFADAVRFNLSLNIALIHKEQGDAKSAEEALKEAATVLAGFAEPDDLSAALIDAVRADLFLSRGQVAPAMTLVPNIEAACTKHGYRAGYLWATARHVRALDLLVKKQIPAAKALWKELAESQRKEGHILLARTLNFLGVCEELLGKDADALKWFEEARTFQAARPRCPPVTRAITLWRLASLTDKAGRKDEAKKLLTEVFDVADRARLNTFGEAAQRAQFFAQFAPAFELLASWCARDGDGEGLLHVVVRSRSRTLLDQMLVAGVDPRDRLTGDTRSALLKRETESRRTVSRLRAQVMLLPVGTASDPSEKKLLAELETAQKEYADVWREIANADPLTRVLTDPAFAGLALSQVRKEAHKSGGALLCYVLGRHESFAVLSSDPTAPPQVFPLLVAQPVAESIGEPTAGDAVAGAGLRGVIIKSTTKQPARPATANGAKLVTLTDVTAGRLVNQYLHQIADPAFNPTRGIVIVSRTPGVTQSSTPEVLGDAVLPLALREKLRVSGAKRLVVIPDGALHKLPFECLLLSANSGPKYALDELPPMCYSPSIAALAVVLGRAREVAGDPSLLTVGDPTYPESPVGASSTTALPRLPYTAEESRRVGEFFPANRVTSLIRDAATEVNVVAAMPGKRFIHLAAHGFADEKFGNAFAAIALAPSRGPADPGNDGFLSLHEIHRLRLTGCELTVLSACVTNVGPQRPMEAGVTLAGAFLGAGSRGVMASCWSVDDRATAELMGTFFNAIRPANGKTISYPEALKAARLAVRGKPGWEAPFFWAPFVYLGPPD